jgi:uncharacterized C2H2 Zn-finger protein
MKILPLSYYNSIKNKNNDNTNKMIDIIDISDLFDVKPFNYKEVALYYDNIELIEGTIAKLMDKNNEIIKKLSVNCIFGQNIIFIIFKDTINIGHLDNNNVFKTEIIIKMNEINNINLNVIIKQIRQFEFNGFKTILFFDENNTSKIHNTNFTVWKLSESNDNNNNNYFNNNNANYWIGGSQLSDSNNKTLKKSINNSLELKEKKENKKLIKDKFQKENNKKSKNKSMNFKLDENRRYNINIDKVTKNYLQLLYMHPLDNDEEIKKIKDEKEEYFYLCTICDTFFKSRDSVREHQWKEHLKPFGDIIQKELKSQDQNKNKSN